MARRIFETPEKVSCSETAKRLGLSPRTLPELVKAGKLHPIRRADGVVEFERAEVERLAAARKARRTQRSVVIFDGRAENAVIEQLVDVIQVDPGTRRRVRAELEVRAEPVERVSATRHEETLDSMFHQLANKLLAPLLPKPERKVRRGPGRPVPPRRVG